ncbi:amidohydrolase family protein [Flavihumibacter stibioxidans]|uniref:Amidohydrolase-related domain-containing protein n=1 Tax=Flavihumibacter stibioxidans TaxID=1834163 RepID=A0ABR7M9A4_9BACT|nr:amidohydrolase family protein [Flavihumibacter stibioxidans]MBC6491607.1 hypothetical protein [Flavihumibacter stibioxidans]
MRYRKFKADHLFTGTAFAPAGSVLISDSHGRIETILPESEAGEDIETFRGILGPGFINCHCHLELSHMKGSIPPGTGMVPFLLAVLAQRSSPTENILEAIAAAATQMHLSGIVAVGDICNTADSLYQKTLGGMAYHNFIEVSGFVGATATSRFQAARQLYEQMAVTGPSSIVPHAPYSVSAELFRLINAQAAGKILTMHNQESPEENDFFLTGQSPFRKLFEAIGVNLDFFTAPGKTSLQSVLPSLHHPKHLILVHNVVTSQQDLDWLHQQQTNLLQLSPGPASQICFCLCPNANQYISNSLPPVELFMKNNCRIVLGTDSLASNYQLNITEEMKTLQESMPAIDPGQILQWATANGAEALGISDRFGTIEKGKTPGIVHIETTENKGRTIFRNSTRII